MKAKESMAESSSYDPLNLDYQSMLDEASSLTGLSNFGDDAFREPLKRLAAALEGEAELNAVGRGMQRARIVGLLVNRLRTEAYIEAFPEILDEEIREPVVIVGLPRTGTTMLHRTISSDPNNYCLYWWESRNPAPFEAPGEELAKGEPDPRIADAEAEVAMMLEGAPDLMVMHPLEARAPDEEIMLLEHSFHSTNPEAFVNVAEFGAWQDEQDQTSAYVYLERLLKFLQWQKKRRGEQASRWVLKTPHHLGFMDLLFKTFPDARVIQTHRDPAHTIPSLASLIDAIRQMGSDVSDSKVTGQQWSGRMSRALTLCMEVREHHAERFIDVSFSDLLQEPLKEIGRIYEFIGWDLDASAIEAMEKWAVDNARDKREAHRYTLEQFGLNEAGIHRDFAEYRRRFVTDE